MSSLCNRFSARCRLALPSHPRRARPGRRTAPPGAGGTAPMKQTGIVKASHDGHQRIESRSFQPPLGVRCAERRQADSDRMGKAACASPRAPAAPNRERARSPLLSEREVQSCPAAARAGRRGRDAGGISLPTAPAGGGDQHAERRIAPRCALLPPVAASLRFSMSRPICPICSRKRSDDFSTAAARAMSAKPSSKDWAERRSRARSRS